MENKKKQIIGKDDLIRLISQKSNFTIKDSEYFWDCFIEVLKDIVEEQIELSVSWFGRLYFTEHIPKKKDVYDGYHKKWVPDKWYRILNFKVSDKLKDILKENKIE